MTETRTMSAASVVPHFMTSKIEEARDFYVQHLGFRPTYDMPGGYVSLRSGGNAATDIGFMAPPPGAPEFSPDGVVYGIQVEDVDAEHERLKSEGVSIVAPPRISPGADGG